MLYNGVIYTMDARPRQAQALCILGERIASIGSDADALDWARLHGLQPAQRIDLRGRLVLPGFVDAHLHLVHFAVSRRQVDLSGARSLEDALELVRRRAASTPPGAWITGGGWDHDAWGLPGYPTRHLLDRVAPHHPVLLHRKDYHSAWANSRALGVAGVIASMADPPGGSIDREPGGAPAGLLRESAAGLVARHIPAVTPAERRAAVQEAQAVAHAAGLTSVHNMEGQEAFATLQELHAAGQLTLRVFEQVPLGSLDAALSLGLRTGLGDHLLRVGCVKLFADGSLGSRTAALLQEYQGEPGNCGMLLLTPADLAGAIRRAYGGGLSVAIHAIGDLANRAVLDALERHRDLARAQALRPRIEHVQLLHPDDLPRLAALGVIASMQPLHATQDMDMAERYWGARSRYGYAWRSLLDAGTVLAFGSDCPVETLDVRQGLYAAVTRRRPDGRPPKGWHPQERLSLAQAVRAYTAGAAWAAGEETLKGRLLPGLLADVVVLDRDLFSGPPEEILAAQVDLTICGGRMVYQRHV